MPRWNESLQPEPDLAQAVEEALDTLKIASSHAIAEWIRRASAEGVRSRSSAHPRAGHLSTSQRGPRPASSLKIFPALLILASFIQAPGIGISLIMELALEK
jgi:hypothetical protein